MKRGHYKKTERKCSVVDCNKKHIYLGYFDIKEEALEARRKAEKKYFGKFAYKEKNR